MLKKGYHVWTFVDFNQNDKDNGHIYGNSALARRCRCTHYLKIIFKNVKIPKQKFRVYIWTIYAGTKRFVKKNYGLCRKDKFGGSKWVFMRHFLSFFTHATKKFLLHKTLCMNIECQDVHPIFLFGIFWHYECFFG